MIKSLYPIFQKWSATGSVYIISDTHFDDPDCKLMDPDWITPQEHMDIIKAEVRRPDTLIHLGDIGQISYLSELKCYKVLIAGNHDKNLSSYKRTIKKEVYDADKISSKELRTKLLKENPFCTVDLYESFEFHAPFHRWIAQIDNHLFDEVYIGPLFIADRLILSHEPIQGLEDFAMNIHGHDHASTFRHNHVNLASNVYHFRVFNLGASIKGGLLSQVNNIHRITIDNATEKNKHLKGDEECEWNNRLLFPQYRIEDCRECKRYSQCRKEMLALGRKEINNMKIYMDMDYIRGYLRYGHREGEVNFTEEEEKEFKELLKKELDGEELTNEEYDKLEGYKYEIEEQTSIIVDDFDIEDYGEYHWEDCLD